MNTNMDEQLPRGWVCATLGEIRLDLTKGIIPGNFPEQYFELYSIPGFDSNAPEILRGKTIKSNKQIIEVNTVLLSKINPRISRAWVVRSFSKYLKIASTEWIPFFSISAINPEYLCYFLCSSKTRDYFASNASGVGGSLMRINDAVVDRYPFPLAPTNEQTRIVAAIEQQFTRLDSAVASLRSAQERAKQYRASLLKAAVEGELTREWRAAHRTRANANANASENENETGAQLLARILAERRARWEAEQIKKMRARGKEPLNDAWKRDYKEPQSPDTTQRPALPDGWCWATVEQVADVGTGATPLRKREEYYVRGTIPWITSGSVNSYFIDSAEEFITKRALEETNAKIFPTGSLILAMYGEGKTRGKVSELRIDAATNQACAAIVFRPFSISCQPYVKYFLLSNYHEIRSGAVGGVQPNLNLGVVKETSIPLPPLAEQAQIVAEVEAQLSELAQTEEAIEHSLRRAEQLRQSILREAFAGRLVEQDPADEPASILLERIREERKKREEVEKIQRKEARKMARASRPRTYSTTRERLYATLRETGPTLSPEELFKEAGFDKIDDQSAAVEKFEAGLTPLLEHNIIAEERPTDHSVLLTAHEVPPEKQHILFEISPAEQETAGAEPPEQTEADTQQMKLWDI